MARRFDPDEELSEIATKLWELDENRCEPGADYELDIQGYVKDARNIRRDRADYPLFTWVDEERVFEKPTYKAFRALLNNYEDETGKPEEVTPEEIQENRNFIDLIMETPVMQECHEFLKNHDKAPEEVHLFKGLLYKTWFKLYRRTRNDRDFDSSGFEHVFVGETRGREVIGCHNWVQIYLQEKHGLIDYRGYFRRGTTEEEENPRLITLQFVWDKHHAKNIGSSFIGTSPEFEVALYTLVHLLDRGDKVPLNIAGYDVEVHCFEHGKFGIGTAYPVSKDD